ncbi:MULTISPECIES: FeoA family protein [Marinilabiliaceae]|uniref:Ferrous iron transport protein A n=1 Tax=Plebeiibacterium marinum TaxID=2992111 RepID=A0AAE3MFM0_9BACT|nr:FeoA family protein [Plebeiobacterium marinum]MCU4164346.1 ferrous iron transport protein A [Marinilabiliaceae bacterium A049]MCW3806700.1 ferrous iron transport protein A [Plebeiobacterium marinum]
MTKILSEMQRAEKGIIKQIRGGKELLARMDSLSLYIGKEIELVSKQSKRGPVVVKLGNTQVAIGSGIAQKIIVDVK